MSDGFWGGFGDFLGSVANTAEGVFDKYIDYETRTGENSSAKAENNYLREILGIQTANASTGGSSATAPVVGSTYPGGIPPVVLYGGIALLAYLALKK